ncbi:Uncharacterized protein HZ326_10644 [Fusarium oxysporum f. sp. albedinis]|nr:Uncharacterized protein HZ326_10644 [Fusarium oxysporum f. sp. albedinis]
MCFIWIGMETSISEHSSTSVSTGIKVGMNPSTNLNLGALSHVPHYPFGDISNVSKLHWVDQTQGKRFIICLTHLVRPEEFRCISTVQYVRINSQFLMA